MLLSILVLSLFTQAQKPADVKAVAEAEYLEFRRMNGPQAAPPVAFLVNERAPSSTPNLMHGLWSAGGALASDTFAFDLTTLHDDGDLMALVGVPKGLVGSDIKSALQKFMERGRESYMMFLGRSAPGPRARLLSRLAGAVERQKLSLQNGAELPLDNHAILMQVEDFDIVAPKTKIYDLHKHADRSTRFDGYRLDMFTGFRIRALLASCRAQITP